MRPEKPKYATELILWILFFSFATSTALLFQNLLLPLFPALHAGQGLLDGDSIYHHSIAVQLAEKIRLHGWSEWMIYPSAGATGNAALLAALYVLFGNNPSLIVPINAAVHAFNGVLIFQIATQLAGGRTGRIAGIVAAVLFVGFPSALNWYGQIHKDGYAISGLLLVIWSWVWMRERPVSVKAGVVLLASTVIGAGFVAFVRPYNLIPLAAVMVVLLGLLAALDLRDLSRRWRKLFLYFVSAALLASSAVWVKGLGIDERYTVASDANLGDWRWKPAGWLPDAIDHLIEISARSRVRLIASGLDVGAGSLIDIDVKPDNVISVIAYAPRALQIGLFAPFPTKWFEKLSVVRLVSVFETLVWYLIAPGLVFAILFRRSSGMLVALCFATLLLYLYGFTIPNVGTLYRIRYPFLFLFIIIGVIGWVEVVLRRQTSRQQGAWPTAALDHAISLQSASPSTSTARIVGAGVIVVLFTGLSYIGLFLRDIILARWFGVGADLDAFFLATTIPMFLVAVISIPLGTMLVPQFLGTKEQQSAGAAQRLVSKIALVYLAAVLVAAGLLLASSAPLLESIGSDFTPGKLRLSQSLLAWMLPILVLSGFVIMNNALLNATGRFTVPSAAQIVVPVVSILALVLFGDRYGVVSVVAGMLAGQIINLWLVGATLGKSGFSVRPAWSDGGVPLQSSLAQYLPLVAAALFVNLAIPVNIGMASTLEEGSAAALGLGSKVVIFITGLVSAGVTTVILPYFSSFMARNRLLDVRNELSFFLLAATVITIPVSLLLFAGAEFIVRLVFEGGAFTTADVRQVARVMSFGILQLPFFTVNLLILEFAIATGHAWRVMTASLFALAVNVGLNLVLMQHSGVAGIALAASLAVAASACFMLLLFNRLGHIRWIDLVVIGLNWMLYTTLVISLQYHSYAGVVVTIMALAILLYGQWQLLTRWRTAA